MYMIMEVYRSYAIALDKEGRFLKVANMHYQVGQTVDHVFEMMDASEDITTADKQEPAKSKKKANRWMAALTTAAACLVLMVTSVVGLDQMTYGSVYLSINPEVRVDVNRNDKVVGLEGLNQDGQDLIEDYSYKGKKLDPVMDELLDRSIEMGYLSGGQTITLTLDGDSEEWELSTGGQLREHLDGYLEDKVTVNIEVENLVYVNNEIVIPVGPDDSGYDAESQSDYVVGDEADDGMTDYGNVDGDSVYDDTIADSASNYEDDTSDYE